jgi:hypothetical protein
MPRRLLQRPADRQRQQRARSYLQPRVHRHAAAQAASRGAAYGRRPRGGAGCCGAAAAAGPRRQPGLQLFSLACSQQAGFVRQGAGLLLCNMLYSRRPWVWTARGCLCSHNLSCAWSAAKAARGTHLHRAPQPLGPRFGTLLRMCGAGGPGMPAALLPRTAGWAGGAGCRCRAG